MAPAVTYERGHVIVAAVRVLRERDGRAPEETDIADLLGWAAEAVRPAVRHLGEAGILRVLRTPFEVRIELGDHALIEDLPREQEAPAIDAEVRSFLGDQAAKRKDLANLFGSGELDARARDKQTDLADQLKAFRPKTPGPFLDDDD